ncbi:MAG: hypothetical protein D4R79_00630 [Comamonadaceae bacterium]|nr:MAG: hypothetical protein D4R79_00630 [Comamonadaceae bacterium]
MTPAQHHDALAQGLTQTDIDDQDAEDEAFDRMAQQASSPAPAAPHFLRCLGHRTEYMLAVPCQHCKRLTATIGADGSISRVPAFVGGRCPLRIQA